MAAGPPVTERARSCGRKEVVSSCILSGALFPPLTSVMEPQRREKRIDLTMRRSMRRPTHRERWEDPLSLPLTPAAILTFRPRIASGGEMETLRALQFRTMLTGLTPSGGPTCIALIRHARFDPPKDAVHRESIPLSHDQRQATTASGPYIRHCRLLSRLKLLLTGAISTAAMIHRRHPELMFPGGAVYKVDHLLHPHDQAPLR